MRPFFDSQAWHSYDEQQAKGISCTYEIAYLAQFVLFLRNYTFQYGHKNASTSLINLIALVDCQ